MGETLIRTHLEADLARVIMAAIRVVVAANVFGELVLRRRLNGADRANVLGRVAVLAAVDALRSFRVVVVFVCNVVVVGLALVVRVAKLLANVHCVELPQVLAPHDVAVLLLRVAERVVAVLVVLVHVGVAGHLLALVVVLLPVVRLERLL